MNNIKSLLIVTGLLLTGNTFAQTESAGRKSNENEITFAGNWKINQNNSTNEFIFVGSDIINTKNNNLSNYSTLFYFVPNNVVLNQNNYQSALKENYFITSTNLADYRTNGNSIKISSDKLNNLSKGLYKPLVIIKDLTNGNIISYEYLDLLLLNNSNSIVKNDYTDFAPLANTNSATATPSSDSKAATDFQTDVNLIGQWKLEIDFNKLLLKISGIDNAIKNDKNEQTNKLRLSVTFVEEFSETDQNISGYKIKDIDLEPLVANGEVKNTLINTNFINRIPQGEYYPVLILSELDKDGTYKIKSTIKYKDKYTL